MAYFAIHQTDGAYVPCIGSGGPVQPRPRRHARRSACSASALGAVHWAKTLMPDEEVVEERHLQRSADADRAGRRRTVINGGGEAAQLGRRPLIKYTLGGALGLFALPLVLQVAGGLGPLPGRRALARRCGSKGTAAHARPASMLPIKAADVTHRLGLPRDARGHRQDSTHVLEEKAKAAVLLMRLDPDDLKVAKARDWGYEGIVAYSKICTHVGCPVGLYEQQTHHLLCPCHQSTFDVTQDCKVIFGPAKRPLPQLKITVDDEGYLVADARRSTKPSARASGSVDEHRRHPKGAAACAPTTRSLSTAHGPVPEAAGGVAGWVDDRTGAAKLVATC